MSDIHYKTARKLLRPSPATTINPQSIIQQSNLTFYNNTLVQKAKTQTKRYTNSNQTQLNNKTIDFADFKSHRKTISMGKPNQSLGKNNEFNPLPEIKIPKNKRGAKKGSFLQIWLNQALDQGSSQPAQSHSTSANDQTLGALKMYGLDKKVLKSKNISEQTIDKIYKKLYVYTKGLGMTFDEVSKLASAKSPSNQSQGGQTNGITEIFWKAFTKLLENESAYETAFQVVEKGHLRAIQELKEKILRMREYEQVNKKVHEQQVRRFERELEVMGTKYKALQMDLNITKSTCELTDKTLDQEILLRLKFEQKINSVYCSYQQIKGKYISLVEEMKLKKQQSRQMQREQKQLKRQLQEMTVACREVEHLLGMQKARSRQLLEELAVKSEERAEMEREMLQREQEKEKEVGGIDEQLQRNKMLYTLANQERTQKQRMKHLYQEQKAINDKFKLRIDEVTQLNNRLYEEKYRIHESLEQAKDTNTQLAKQIAQSNQYLTQLTKQLSSAKLQVQSLANQLTHQKSIKSDIAQQLQIKAQLLLKASQTLDKLKEVKDRHQRLQKLAQNHRDNAIQQKVSAMAKMQQQEHNLQALSDQLNQTKHQADINLNRLNKTIQLTKKKVTELQEQINKKQKTILTHLNTIQVERISVMKRQKQIQELKQRLESKDNNIYKLQATKLYLQTNQPIVQQKLQKTEEQLKTHAQLQIQNLTQQQQLNTQVAQLEGLLKVKTDQTHVETQVYKKLSQYYKVLFVERGNYIHPMVYEDTLGMLNKLSQVNSSLSTELQTMTETKEQFKQQQLLFLQQTARIKHNLQTLTNKINQLTENNLKLQTHNDSLLANINDQTNKLLTLNLLTTNLKSYISTLQNDEQQLNQSLNHAHLSLAQTNHHLSAKIILIQQLQKQNLQLSTLYQTALHQNQSLKNKLQPIPTSKPSTTTPEPLKQPQTPTFQPLKYSSPQLALISKQTQTQTISHPSNQMPISHLNLNHSSIPPLAQQTPQSKQIVHQLLHQTQLQDQHPLPIRQIQPLPSQKPSNPIPQQKNQSPQPKNDKKKVQKKQFQRALKLTFMRR